MMNIIIFEDKFTADLKPFTYNHASFEIKTGLFSNLERFISCFKNKNIINLGIINDEHTLRLIYSASDLVMIPSIQEAFGLTAYEAIHCGTPCVVFENTGLASIIDHKISGYISKFNFKLSFNLFFSSVGFLIFPN